MAEQQRPIESWSSNDRIQFLIAPSGMLILNEQVDKVHLHAMMLSPDETLDLLVFLKQFEQDIRNRSQAGGTTHWSDEQMIKPEDRTHQCPDCGEEAIILVNIETETVPELDSDGNKQYGCPNCHRTFSVDADGAVVQPPPDGRQ